MRSTNRPLVNSPAPDAINGTPSFQLGVSLIELMISITIGLLILVALSTLFVNQSRARIELDKSNRMIDNGSYALKLLSDNLSMAGYYGEFIPTSGVPALPAALPDPCSTDPVVMAGALQLAVQGYDAATPTGSISSLPPLCGLTYTAGSALTLKPGSDILALRRASTSTSIQVGSALNGTHYIQSSLCQYDAVAFKLDTNLTNLNLRVKLCTSTGGGALAAVRQFVTQIYFVSTDDKPGDGIPTLKRLELDPTTHVFVTTPLVEGIDYMQIEYGLDTDGNGSADSYVSNPGLTDWPNVVAIKMHLLARNTESTPNYVDTKTYNLGLAGTVTPHDAYKRHSYTQYIRLINPSGRREVQ